MSQIGAAAIQAGSSIVNGVLGSYMNDRNNRENRKNMQWAYNKNLEQWNRENAYNLPLAQISRMKSAGLNPALMYDSGTGMIPAASSPQTDPSAGRSEAYRPNIQIDPFVSANIELAKSQAEKNRADAAKAESDVDVNKQVELRVKKEVEDFEHRWNLMNTEAQLNVAKKLDISFQQLMADKNYRLSLRELENNIRKTTQEIKESESREAINLVNAEYLIKTLTLRCLGVQLQNDKLLSEIGLNQSLVRKADKEAALLGYQVNEGFGADLLNRIYNDKIDMSFEQYGEQRPAISTGGFISELVQKALRLSLRGVKLFK